MKDDDASSVACVWVEADCVCGRRPACTSPFCGVTVAVPKVELSLLPLEGEAAKDSRGLSTRLEIRLSISDRRSSVDLPGGVYSYVVSIVSEKGTPVTDLCTQALPTARILLLSLLALPLELGEPGLFGQYLIFARRHGDFWRLSRGIET